MFTDPTAKGKDHKQGKVFVTVGNIIAGNESRLEEALYYVSRGVDIAPTLPYTHNSRGSVLHKMGRIMEAKSEFEVAIKYNPNYANAHFNLGVVLYQTGDKQSALWQFQKTLQLDPGHSMAQLQMQNMHANGEIFV